MLPILTVVKRQTVSIHTLAVYYTTLPNTSGGTVVLLSCCEVGTNVTGSLCLANNYQHFLVKLLCELRRDSHSAALRPLFNILINTLHIEIEYILLKNVNQPKLERIGSSLRDRTGLLNNLHKLEKHSARDM